MKARKFFTGLGICAVTAVAGAISYRHQSGLAVWDRRRIEAPEDLLDWRPLGESL